MINFFKKYINPILFLALLLVLWQFPASMRVISVIFLSVSLAVAFSFIIKKHREAYLQNKITRGVFVRNVLVEITGILLAMALAGLLGRIVAQFMTAQISNDLTNFSASIIIGLLAGTGIGIFVKRTWERLVKPSLEKQWLAGGTSHVERLPRRT